MSFARLAALAVAGLLVSAAAQAQGTPPALSPTPPPLSIEPSQTDAQTAEWFVAVEGQPQGPMTRDDVIALIAERGMDQTTQVWRDGMAAWIAISEVAELQPANDDSANDAAADGEVADTRQYYVAEGDSSTGPLTRAQVEQRIQTGAITANTMIWRDDMTEWAPVSATDLAALIDEDNAVVSQEADPLSIIVGTWQGSVMQPVDGFPEPIDIDVTMTYDASGRISGTGQSLLDLTEQGVPEPVSLNIVLEGTWSGEALDATRVNLRTTVTMRMTVPELDMPEETETYDEASVVEIVDRDTLRDEDGTLIRRVGG